jgi:tellurite resistance-related uncharacterized protein
MIRNVEKLVVALLAVFVVGAVVAPAASAVLFRTNNPGETVLFGGQENNKGAFGTEYAEIKCAEGSYNGTTVGEELATFQLTPSYTGCKFPAGTATVKMNGCTYVFAAGEFDEKSNFEGWINIVCPAGQKMAIETTVLGVKTCTITIPPQNELKTVTYTNRADSELNFFLEAEVKITGATYSQDPGTGGVKCPGKENLKNGTFASTITLHGKKPEGGAVNVWIE